MDRLRDTGPRRPYSRLDCGHRGNPTWVSGPCESSLGTPGMAAAPGAGNTASRRRRALEFLERLSCHTLSKRAIPTSKPPRIAASWVRSSPLIGSAHNASSPRPVESVTRRCRHCARLSRAATIGMWAHARPASEHSSRDGTPSSWQPVGECERSGPDPAGSGRAGRAGRRPPP
jgi:hypothetical protein